MAAELILVKHSLPETDPSRPPRAWRLSVEGRARCTPLASRLARHAPSNVVSSAEPKAVETAAILAAALCIPHRVGAQLHEHDREGVPLFATAAEFEAQMRRVFTAPGDLVLGRETATQAGDRFAAGVAEVLAQTPPDEVPVIVAHGTVISLYVAAGAGLCAWELWRRLGMPSFVRLRRPSGDVAELVERIAG